MKLQSKCRSKYEGIWILLIYHLRIPLFLIQKVSFCQCQFFLLCCDLLFHFKWIFTFIFKRWYMQNTWHCLINMVVTSYNLWQKIEYWYLLFKQKYKCKTLACNSPSRKPSEPNSLFIHKAQTTYLLHWTQGQRLNTPKKLKYSRGNNS